MEYTCESQYKLLTQNLEKMHIDELNKMKAEMTTIIENKFELEREHYNQIYEARQSLDQSENKRKVLQKEVDYVVQELNKANRKVEEETRLRLFFETKINSLQHLNMALESKYQIALLEKGKQTKEIEKQKAELLDCKK